MSLLDHLIAEDAAYQRERTRKAEKRTKLLDSDNLDKAVAGYLTALSPSKKKPKRGFASKVDAAESTIPSDHPLSGSGADLREAFKEILSDPSLGKYDPQMLMEMTAGEVLAPRIVGAHEYKFQKDTGALGGLLPDPRIFFGEKGRKMAEDDDVKKLPSVFGLPSHDEYVDLKMKGEIPAFEHANPLVSMLWGAGFKAAEKGVVHSTAKYGTKVGLTWLAKRAIPAAVGTVLAPELAVAAAVAVPLFEIYNLVGHQLDKSTYGRAHENTWRLHGAKLIAGGFLPGAVGSKFLKKAAISSMRSGSLKAETLEKVWTTKTGKAVIEHGRAARAHKLSEEVLEKAVKGIKKEDIFNLGLEGDIFKSAVVKEQLGPGAISLTEKTRAVVPVGKVFNKIFKETNKVEAAIAKAPPKAVFNKLSDKGVDTVLKRVAANPKLTMPEATKQVAFDEVTKLTTAKKEVKGYFRELVAKKKVTGKKVHQSDLDRRTLEHFGWAGGEGIEELSRVKISRIAEELKREAKEAAILKGKKALIPRIIEESSKSSKLPLIEAKARRLGIKPKNYTEEELEALVASRKQLTAKTSPAAKQLMAEEVKETRLAVAEYDKKIFDTVDELMAGGMSEAEAFENDVVKRLIRESDPLIERLAPDIDLAKDMIKPVKGRKPGMPKPEGPRDYTTITEADLAGDIVKYSKDPARLKTFLQDEYGEIAVKELESQLASGATVVDAGVAAAAKGEKYSSIQMGLRRNRIDGAHDRSMKDGLAKVADDMREGLDKVRSDKIDKITKVGERTAAEEEELASLIASQAADDGVAVDKFLQGENIFQGNNPRKSMSKKLLTTIALGGTTVLLSSLLDVEEAEAANLVTTTISKAAAAYVKKAGPKNSLAIMKEAKAAKLTFTPPKEGQKYMPEAMEQLDVAELVYKNSKRAHKAFAKTKQLPLGLDRLLSPYQFANYFYKPGYNAGIQLGSMQSAMSNHIEAGHVVFNNIVKNVKGYKDVSGVVAKEFEPLAEKYSGTVIAASAIDSKLTNMLTRKARALEKLKKPNLKDKKETIDILRKAEKEIEVLKKSAAELSPKVKEFDSKYEEIAKALAKKYPSVRMAFAAEDTAKYEFTPWLKGMLTYEEESAVAHTKNLFSWFTDRMTKAGHRTVESRPFVHHAWHPKWRVENAETVLTELKLDIKPSLPFTKFHKRAKFSKQMVPDLGYSVRKYIPDAEKRIQWDKFWQKGKKDGWYAHMKSAEVQNTTPIRKFWERIVDSSKGGVQSGWNTWMNRYQAIETALMIGFSPAVAFKHIFKNEGTWGALGFRESVRHLPDAISMTFRNARNFGAPNRLAKRFGLDISTAGKAFDEFEKSYTNQYRMVNMLSDLELQPASLEVKRGFWGFFDRKLESFNKSGSIFVRGIEAMDRGHSFVAALDMAAKKGMTGKQASYGIWDTIIKNNFLGSELNPRWVQNPTIRAMMLFQNTPFKILERRVIAALKVKSDLKHAGGIIKAQGLERSLKELRDMKKFVKTGESELKQNLMLDYLREGANRDFFGTLVGKQLMREILYSGAVIYGIGSALDMDLMPHTVHLPFFKSHYASDPTIATSPFATAAWRLFHEGQVTKEYGGEPEYSLSEFMGHWLGAKGAIPLTFRKVMRINENDIPEIYKGSQFKYLFSIPTVGH